MAFTPKGVAVNYARKKYGEYRKKRSFKRSDTGRYAKVQYDRDYARADRDLAQYRYQRAQYGSPPSKNAEYAKYGAIALGLYLLWSGSKGSSAADVVGGAASDVSTTIISESSEYVEVIAQGVAESPRRAGAQRHDQSEAKRVLGSGVEVYHRNYAQLAAELDLNPNPYALPSGMEYGGRNRGADVVAALPFGSKYLSYVRGMTSKYL